MTTPTKFQTYANRLEEIEMPIEAWTTHIQRSYNVAVKAVNSYSKLIKSTHDSRHDIPYQARQDIVHSLDDLSGLFIEIGECFDVFREDIVKIIEVHMSLMELCTDALKEIDDHPE